MSEDHIINGWLCEVWNGCTCGAGPGTPGDTHEPGCGLEPIVELSTLDGWPDTAQAVAIEREATSAFLERVANYATHPMIGEGGEWRRVVSDIELRAIAQAIRNGEHVKP